MNRPILVEMSNMQAPQTGETESKSPWLAQGDQKRVAIRSMFDEIAPTYDKLNRLITLHLDKSWRRQALLWCGIKPEDRVLDLCCGTGDFLVEAMKLTNHCNHLGIDFSLPMLENGTGKNLPTLALGDACAIPVKDGAFDVVSVGWGIRNVPDIDLAHREIFRVLNSGGRFVSVDMAMPKNRVMLKICTFVFQQVVPRLGARLSQAEAYKYLPESTKRFLSREELSASMVAAGFKSVTYRDLFFGNICVHWGTKN